jgi:hypothetical protein
MSDRREAAGAQSWILELRSRLGADDGARPEQDGVALLVGLFVEDGRLWVALLEHFADEGPEGAHLALPAAELEAGADPWSGAARAAVDALGIDPASVLRIGRLAPHFPDPALGLDVAFHPCVAAIPPPGLPLGDAADAAGVVRLPLHQLAAPELVERREVRAAGRPHEVDVVDVGGHTIWGPTVAVLDNLLAHLGVGN